MNQSVANGQNPVMDGFSFSCAIAEHDVTHDKEISGVRRVHQHNGAKGFMPVSVMRGIYLMSVLPAYCLSSPPSPPPRPHWCSENIETIVAAAVDISSSSAFKGAEI